MSWINDMDALASAGVISFDAPAYIHGVTPRYVGNPPLETIPDKLPQMKKQLQKDEFTKNSPIPAWKKWLMAGIATAAVLFGGAKIIKNKGLLEKINLSAIKTFPSKAMNKAKELWAGLKGKFVKTS